MRLSTGSGGAERKRRRLRATRSEAIGGVPVATCDRRLSDTVGSGEEHSSRACLRRFAILHAAPRALVSATNGFGDAPADGPLV